MGSDSDFSIDLEYLDAGYRLREAWGKYGASTPQVANASGLKRTNGLWDLSLSVSYGLCNFYAWSLGGQGGYQNNLYGQTHQNSTEERRYHKEVSSFDWALNKSLQKDLGIVIQQDSAYGSHGTTFRMAPSNRNATMVLRLQYWGTANSPVWSGIERDVCDELAGLMCQFLKHSSKPVLCDKNSRVHALAICSGRIGVPDLVLKYLQKAVNEQYEELNEKKTSDLLLRYLVFAPFGSGLIREEISKPLPLVARFDVICIFGFTIAAILLKLWRELHKRKSQIGAEQRALREAVDEAKRTR